MCFKIFFIINFSTKSVVPNVKSSLIHMESDPDDNRNPSQQFHHGTAFSPLSLSSLDGFGVYQSFSLKLLRLCFPFSSYIPASLHSQTTPQSSHSHNLDNLLKHFCISVPIHGSNSLLQCIAYQISSLFVKRAAAEEEEEEEAEATATATVVVMVEELRIWTTN